MKLEEGIWLPISWLNPCKFLTVVVQHHRLVHSILQIFDQIFHLWSRWWYELWNRLLQVICIATCVDVRFSDFCVQTLFFYTNRYSPTWLLRSNYRDNITLLHQRPQVKPKMCGLRVPKVLLVGWSYQIKYNNKSSKSHNGHKCTSLTFYAVWQENINVKEPTKLDAAVSVAVMTNSLSLELDIFHHPYIHIITPFKTHFSFVYLLLYNNDYSS